MKILAIYPAHNANVGVFIDGKCECIYHEEKFSNKKHHLGWPHRALKYLSGIYNLNEFDYITITSEQQFYYPDDRYIDDVIKEQNTYKGRLLEWAKNIYYLLWYVLGNYKIFSDVFKYYLHNIATPNAKKQMELTLEKEYGIKKEKIKYIEHHLAHALTTHYFYGLGQLKKDILYITMDGLGDNYFSRIYHYHSNEDNFEMIAQSPFSASLGLLYTEITRFLGMKPNEHEYKVMGLAAYVNNSKYYNHIYKMLEKYFWLDKNTLTFKSKVNTFISIQYLLRNNLVGERFDNISAAIQKFIEDKVIEYIKTVIDKTGIKNVALSGGVFMNVKLNKKISEMEEIEKVYFQPSSGDDSSVIGCAAKIFRENNIELIPVKTMYLGRSYTNSEVGDFLKGYEDKYCIDYFENRNDLYEKITDLLKNFEIVALHRGRGEWGARSLCNRTILGNASDLKTFHEVNNMIKMRDFWMPFAPTILFHWADRYIKNWDMLKNKIYDSSKYMILGFDSTELAQKHLRAAIHQKDKTLRPQILEEKDNPDIFNIFKLYEKKTDMGGMMNTSLNIHGYPLAGTLEQSFNTFINSGLKYIALENYLISKKT